MTRTQNSTRDANRRWRVTLLIGCVLLCVVGGVVSVLALLPRRVESPRSNTDVPLGVEQAVIVRYSGPRLQARPYRPGASVNLRIADQQQKGEVWVYDVRYVVSLPGEFDLTEYLTAVDGRSIEDLPPFRVRGLTSLTKDIETRIRELEHVGVHIWHWYYETLVVLAVVWIAWLLGLIFIGRPRRQPKVVPAPRRPSTLERIELLLATMADRELTTEEKASLETLLLNHWRDRLGLTDRRMATSCRHIARCHELGPVYRELQAWLHNPSSAVAPEEFVRSYTRQKAFAT